MRALPAGKARTEGAAHFQSFQFAGAAEPRLASGGEAAANVLNRTLEQTEGPNKQQSERLPAPGIVHKVQLASDGERGVVVEEVLYSGIGVLAGWFV